MCKLDEIYYYAFVIGYDLLHDEFVNSKEPECDIVFEKCMKMATNFMKSNDYADYDGSAYEALRFWLSKEII